MGSQDQDANKSQGRWSVIPRTLCLITSGDDLLLLKRGAQRRVLPGKYNGVGGHIERHEDLLTSALREIEEETGLKVKDTQLRGIVHIDTGKETGVLLFIYTAEALQRDFRDTDEGSLEWVPIPEINNKNLVEDLPHLLKHLLGEQAATAPFFAHLSYDDQDRAVLRFQGE